MNEAHIIYSPDDGGWYWQRWSDGSVSSEVFATPIEARRDFTKHTSLTPEGGCPVTELTSPPHGASTTQGRKRWRI